MKTLLLEDLLELEADGYELTAEGALVHGPFTALETLQDGLRSRAGACRTGAISGIRSTASTCSRAIKPASACNYWTALEALDDVRSVSCNLGRSQSSEASSVARANRGRSDQRLHRLLPVLRFAHPELLRGKSCGPHPSHCRQMDGESS